MSADPTAVFSLVAGGPAHGLQQRLGLVGPASFHPARRTLVAILVTWVVLLVLSAVQGLAIGGGVKIPFLYDYAAYARFLIAIPVLMPAVTQLGIDPVHFGLIVVLNLMIGLLHPPMGMVLYVLARVARMSLERTTMAILPWLVPLLGSLILITYVPIVSLWLPRLFYR